MSDTARRSEGATETQENCLMGSEIDNQREGAKGNGSSHHSRIGSVDLVLSNNESEGEDSDTSNSDMSTDQQSSRTSEKDPSKLVEKYSNKNKIKRKTIHRSSGSSTGSEPLQSRRKLDEDRDGDVENSQTLAGVGEPASGGSGDPPVASADEVVGVSCQSGLPVEVAGANTVEVSGEQIQNPLLPSGLESIQLGNKLLDPASLPTTIHSCLRYRKMQTLSMFDYLLLSITSQSSEDEDEDVSLDDTRIATDFDSLARALEESDDGTPDGTIKPHPKPYHMDVDRLQSTDSSDCYGGPTRRSQLPDVPLIKEKTSESVAELSSPSRVTCFLGEGQLQEVKNVCKSIQLLRATQRYSLRSADWLFSRALHCRNRLLGPMSEIFLGSDSGKAADAVNSAPMNPYVGGLGEAAVGICQHSSVKGEPAIKERSSSDEDSDSVSSETEEGGISSDWSGGESTDKNLIDEMEQLTNESPVAEQPLPCKLTLSHEPSSVELEVAPQSFSEVMDSMGEVKLLLRTKMGEVLKRHLLLVEYVKGSINSRLTTVECVDAVEESAEYACDALQIVDRMEQRAEGLTAEQVPMVRTAAEAARLAASVLQEQCSAVSSSAAKATDALTRVREAKSITAKMTVHVVEVVKEAVLLLKLVKRAVRVEPRLSARQVSIAVERAACEARRVVTLAAQVTQQGEEVARSALREAVAAADAAYPAVPVCSEWIGRCEYAVHHLMAQVHSLSAQSSLSQSGTS